MRVLITGASGFIGGAVARALLEQGHELVCAARDPSRLDLPPGRWQALQADLAQVPSRAWWQPHLAGVDAVVNAVGILRESPGQAFEALHARAPTELFFAAAAAGVKAVVQVSALGADDKAESRYHLTKRQADTMLRALPVAGAVVQPSVVYGPGADSTAMFHLMAAAPVLALPDAGRMWMQPVHVDDVVAGILALLAEPPRPVATVSFVGPRRLTMADYLRRLHSALGLPGPLPVVLRMPRRVFLWVARVAGNIPGSTLDRDTAGMLIRGSWDHADDFTRLLGRAPRGVEQFIDPAQAPALRRGLFKGLGRIGLRLVLALAVSLVLAQFAGGWLRGA